VVRLSDSLAGKWNRPYLQKAAGQVRDFAATADTISLNLDCFGDRGMLALAGLAPQTSYAVSGTALKAESLQSDQQGRLLLENLHSGTVELQRQ